MTNKERARLILEALEASPAPISWHWNDAPALIRVIAAELERQDSQAAATVRESGR